MTQKSDMNASMSDATLTEIDIAPAAKRAQEKAEYEKRRQIEEELKRQMEEEIQQQILSNPDYYEEKGKTIPIEELIKKGVARKMKEMNNTLSKTMYTENFNQPVINLQTTIDTNTMGYKQRSDTMMP